MAQRSTEPTVAIISASKAKYEYVRSGVDFSPEIKCVNHVFPVISLDLVYPPVWGLKKKGGVSFFFFFVYPFTMPKT